MFRRAIRIVAIVGLVALIVTALFSQYWGPRLNTPNVVLLANANGIYFGRSVLSRYWDIGIDDQEPTWRHRFYSPFINRNPAVEFIFLPWWLVVSIDALFSLILWRLTRKRNIVRAFPVEAVKNSD